MSKQKIRICSILLFSIFFFKLTYLGFSPTISGWFINGCFLLLAALLIKDIKYLFSSEYRWINIFVVAYCVISILSVEMNVDYVNSLSVVDWEGYYISGVQSSKGVLYSSLGLVMTALFMERVSVFGRVEVMLRTLLCCMGALLVFTDIDAMQHVVINDSIDGYMVGNKFTVCYLNLYFCSLYYMLHPNLRKKEMVLLTLFLLILVMVSIHTRCSTTLLGAAVFVSMTFLPKKKFRTAASKPRYVFLTLFVCDILFFFFTPWFLQFEVVQDFIVNVLHEDLTLTGRLDIYMNIQDAFNESPWIGYGVGNSGIMSMMYAGVFDAQNGLVDMFLQVGFLGCGCFLAILGLLLKQVGDSYENVYPIVVLVYAILAISMVEIPFKHSFVFMTFLLLSKNRPMLIASNNIKNNL